MRFPIYTALCIMMVGLFFFMYIVVNYGLHNPDSGAFTLLDDKRDIMMNTDYSDWARELLDYNHSWWGTGFVVLIVITIICVFIDLLKSPKEG